MVVSAEHLSVVEQRVANEDKSTGLAYVLWFFTGLLGIHNFYIGRVVLGILEPGLILLGAILLGGGAGAKSGGTGAFAILCFLASGILLFLDLFTVPGAIRKHRERLRKQYIAEFASQPRSQPQPTPGSV
jgi:TM2 domain-containing membrane protein YozV